MNKHQFLLLAISLVLGLPGANPAFAAGQDESGSLESIWMDQPAPPAAVKAEERAAVEAAAPAVETTEASPTRSLSTPSGAAAPMCSWKEFKDSSFLVKGAWPGVGPFKPSSSDSSDLTDESQNRLKLDVTNDQVNKAELYLGKPGVQPSARDFLDMEMSGDFLLEALGAKPKKIAEFNAALEKQRDSLMKGRNASLNLRAGHYLVTIDRSRSVSPYSCLIAVNSLDAHQNVIKEHSLAGSGEENTAPNVPEPVTIAAVKKVGAGDGKKTSSQIKKPTTAINPTIDPKRDEFVQAIKNWQSIKKVAVRKHDTAQLSEILSGRALARQTDAVKWLATNKKYYDMVPKGVTVEKYQEVTPGKKYSVVAIVREFSKFIDEGSGQVLKEVDDKYTVNYTLEKIGDHWSIADSQLLATASGGPNQKSAAASKSHR